MKIKKSQVSIRKSSQKNFEKTEKSKWKLPSHLKSLSGVSLYSQTLASINKSLNPYTL